MILEVLHRRHVTPFQTMSTINYDKVTFIDQDGNKYYQMYEPIRIPGNDGGEYIYPEGFDLIETDVVTEPYGYYRL